MVTLRTAAVALMSFSKNRRTSTSKLSSSFLRINLTKNSILLSNLIVSLKTHFLISPIISTDSIYRDTRNLFDEITQRNARVNRGATRREDFCWTWKSWRYDQSKLPNSSFDSLSCCTLKPFDEILQRHNGIQLSPHAHENLTDRSVVSWTVRISWLIARHREEEAIELFKLMLLHGERPNHVTLLAVIRAVVAMKSEVLTKEIHAVVIKNGFDSVLSVVTVLLGLYSMYSIASVFRLFNQTPAKDLILWSALIAACSKNGQLIESIKVFREMQCFGIEPNNVSVVSILNACADLGALFVGKQLHGFSLRKGFLLNTNLQNSLVDVYSKCGKLDNAILVFDGIHNKDLVSWNTMICGCAENGHSRKALAMFSTMRSLYLEPDETTFRAALRACLQMEELVSGLALHCHILKSGLSDSVSVATALLTMYADFGEVATSQFLFDHLHHRDFIAWSAMVSAYARAGHPNLAVNTFKQMESANEKANEVTLVSLLQACSSMGAQGHGKSIHARVVRAGYSCNKFIASALIDFYSKLGLVCQGRALFDRIECKDVICWSSMINGYGMNGCGEEALEAVSNMLKEPGLQPNGVVFLSVLSACSHCGLVSEGLKWFSCMEKKYGVVPTLEHYACMVDLFSRSGRVKEALEFINDMPLEPDVSVWGALLTGCRATHGEVEVAEIAAGHLFRLDPDNTSYYVILSNMYAKCGWWGDVERLRRVAREKRLRKTVGYSMVEASQLE